MNKTLNTHKSRAEIDGGSVTNSNSGGGSFGTNGFSDACFRISCCFCCWEAGRAVVLWGPIRTPLASTPITLNR